MHLKDEEKSAHTQKEGINNKTNRWKNIQIEVTNSQITQNQSHSSLEMHFRTSLAETMVCQRRVLDSHETRSRSFVHKAIYNEIERLSPRSEHQCVAYKRWTGRRQ